MKRFSVGLVVGKFAPLHKGHELVIRAALAQCDRVILLSYSKPEFPGCERHVREKWLEALFPECTRVVITDDWLRDRRSRFTALPSNDAEGSVHHDLVWHVTTDLLNLDVDAVFTSEDYGEAFARSLTRFRRRRLPSAPDVVHVSVDAARKQVPISGTELRTNVHERREFLHRAVYASFVERVAILGGESSGKSTLSAALAKHFRTKFTLEFGREHWEARGGVLTPGDMLHIGETQVALEEKALPSANRYLFCDTTPLTTAHYSRVLFDSVDPLLVRLAERPYHHTVLCEPDFPFVQDGTRRDERFRAEQHEAYLEALRVRGTSFWSVSGPPEARVRAVAGYLSRA